ncbi:hypothetical protein [Desulfobacter vibrioformis]|nr:hypothetical protein [Desulfobacter vibrioformis]
MLIAPRQDNVLAGGIPVPGRQGRKNPGPGPYMVLAMPVILW